MSDVLVLFCGGPSIYGGMPKPLQQLPNGELLIERYLNFLPASFPKEVVLLVDQSFADNYYEFINNFLWSTELKIFCCADHSSTFSKLKTYLYSESCGTHNVMFSYPDIFIAGDIVIPDSNDDRLADAVFISFTPVFSRFPRIVVDPFHNIVKGISNHFTSVPANPLHVFGGHLFSRFSVMQSLLESFLTETEIPQPSLEFDMFFWLINSMRMHAMPIYGPWTQADSQREIEAIISLT